ncbi:MAG: DUF4143 domain-containing protein [Mycoplasmataceae bacterium]|nr:DUF4143 domain-containing protein [Mycoplasmataceae bacterium]
MDFLERMFLIEYLPVWNLHIRSSIQLRTTRKFYFSDVSIACASLNIDSISKLENDEKH